MNNKTTELNHPMDPFLRVDRMPHIWCPGCGIGTGVKGLEVALEKENIDLNKVAVVSGIGCSGRTAGYVKLDSFHTTHGRPIPFATGLKLANPNLKVIVFSGDGDIFAIGGNHFIHAARRNMDITVICINNFIYGMTGGQVTPTTPEGANCSTTPYGNPEIPFNLPKLAISCGATYVARWTSLNVKRITESIGETLNKKGFSFIEIIAPCPTLYSRRNKLGEGVNQLHYYQQRIKFKDSSDIDDTDIYFQDEITIGKFLDINKPTYSEAVDNMLEKKLGDKYVRYFSRDGEKRS